MATEFHLFMTLPSELRLKVWEHALRSPGHTRPGAHFFSVTNYKESRVDINWSSRREPLYEDCYRLGAPKSGPGEHSSLSWTGRSNLSAYLWDYGLWTACPESRHVVEQHYKTRDWAETLQQTYSSTNRHYKPPLDACVRFVFPRGDTESYRFAVHPNRDLFCIQLLDTSSFSWFAKRACLLDDVVCRVNWTRGLFGFENVAFEYDASWCDGLGDDMDIEDFEALSEENSPRALFIRTVIFMDDVSTVFSKSSIWLIDYELKRIADKTAAAAAAAAADREATTFYGRDRKFVHVDGDAKAGYAAGKSSAFEFLDRINRALVGVKPAWLWWGYRGRYWKRCSCCEEDVYVQTRYFDSLVRVLSCES